MQQIKHFFRWPVVTASIIIGSMGLYFFIIYKDLPRTYKLEDYQPSLITLVYDRNQNIIGEFFKERRFLVSFENLPQHLIRAFVSAEDGSFFEHSGINYKSIFRALIANIQAGRKVQGGSTITQQLARSLLLSRKKTYARKIQEAILALRMERHLSKEEILYLYLNQIYLGHGAYGVGMASRIYFKKEVKDLTLAESTLLAGLPQAPSRFSPIINPKKAKNRQKYVLQRMFNEGYISEKKMEETKKTSVQVYKRESYFSRAPFFIETIRQILIDKIGEKALLTSGLKIQTSLDISMQEEAQKQLRKGLEDLDKRQGYRGAINKIDINDLEIVQSFFEKKEKKWVKKRQTYLVLSPDGTDSFDRSQFKKFNFEDQTQGIVTKVEDELAYVDLMFGQKGIISIETTRWARKPNKKINSIFHKLQSMHHALKEGDVIRVRIENPKKHQNNIEYIDEEILKEHQLLTLEQKPVVEGALISFDQKTQDIVAMVGGYNFSRSQFNRAIQAKRQTGSVFKPIVYSAALDKGFLPNSVISDEPVVYEDAEADLLKKAASSLSISEDEEVSEEDKKTGKWKPSNYSQYFTGDTLLRNALIKSLNVPTVKLIEEVGIPWVEFYSRRLGIVNKLNSDYTLALGSSSLTLYEMTKAFSIFGRLGKQITPFLVQEVISPSEELILSSLSLDEKISDELSIFKEEFQKSWDSYWETNEEENSVFFKELDQIIPQETAYIMTSLLKGVIQEGTGRRARHLKHSAAGKTGTTNGYYDAWFIGYTSSISTGVWVGFDNEDSLGQGEGGARAALPIWYQYMKNVHKDMELLEFEVPPNIVFANIDNDTGYLASSSSQKITKQAFLEGTAPKEQNKIATESEEQNFFRKDMSL